jgi:hypothetical protein
MAGADGGHSAAISAARAVSPKATLVKRRQLLFPRKF